MKKINARRVRKAFQVVFPVVLSVVLSNCFGCADDPTMLGLSEVGLPKTGTMSIRNFRQIPAYYSVATGVSESNNNVRNYFNANFSRFSLDGDAGAVSPATLSALTSFAGIYCQENIRLERANTINPRLLHGAVDFSQNSSRLTPEVLDRVIQKYSERFWRKVTPPAESRSVLMQVFEDVKKESTSVDVILLAGCSVAAVLPDAVYR